MGWRFSRAPHMHCHDFCDTITIVASPYQIMIPSMAYERDIATQWPCFLPTDGCFSCYRCAVLLVCVTSSVVFATPKALATHMAKFLSPLRGFVAPLSGAVSTVAFRGLRTLRVLAHGYEKSRPAGGNAAARPIGSRRRDAGRHTPVRRRDDAQRDGGTPGGTAPKPQAGRPAAHRRPQAGRRAAHPRPQAGRTAALPRPQAGRTAAHTRPQAGRRAACL